MPHPENPKLNPMDVLERSDWFIHRPRHEIAVLMRSRMSGGIIKGRKIIIDISADAYRFFSLQSSVFMQSVAEMGPMTSILIWWVRKL
jgi:hypothetical protein